MYENANKQLTQQSGSQSNQPMKVTLGACVESISNRIANCHSYVNQIEDRLNGPIPQAVNSDNSLTPNALQPVLEMALDNVCALENRLGMLLDRI